MVNLRVRPSLSRHYSCTCTTKSTSSIAGAVNIDDIEHIRGKYPHDFGLFLNIIGEDEEKHLADELRQIFRKKSYINNHWDDVIAFYKEVELSEVSMSVISTDILNKCRSQLNRATNTTYRYLPPHAIELSQEGYIGNLLLTDFLFIFIAFVVADGHVDNVKFSGELVAGLSLLSCRRMLLVPETPAKGLIDCPSFSLTIPPRSLYFIRGPLRYNYTHAILGRKGMESTTGLIQESVHKRISIIFRDVPFDD